MKKPVSLQVNLLPKDPFLDTPLGKLLQWAMSVGRYLIIFTEVIVILSFASRFTLDRRITDLNGAIQQKKSIINSYGDLEENIKAIQKKTTNYIQVEQQENIIEIFPVLTQITPNDVVMDSLEIQPGRVILNGVARSNVSLSLLINNLQFSGRFSDVDVEKIETAQLENSGFEFRIQAVTTKVKPK